ncbi:hypothetical protein [Cellulosilyticum sp. I15G10I2]|nr:hypothetical protein [Cellulosilyticum sp. I15G10I2]
MNNIILNNLKQFEAVQYPNPSHGYGIFDIQLLSRLLVAAPTL